MQAFVLFNLVDFLWKDILVFLLGRIQKTKTLTRFLISTTVVVSTIFLTTAVLRGQTTSPDSSKYKSIQQQLDGCWKTKHYQFKYSQKQNTGMEYKSHVHSSAPIFSLILKDNSVYIEWIELTGGGSLQKITGINKNKLKVVNEDGMNVVYQRNKGCK